MIRSSRVLGAIGVGVLLAITPLAFGQTVNDLTGESVSPDKLIAVLTPKEGPPSAQGGGSRGLTLVAPGCKHFRTEAERGIALTPKADIAAITIEFASGSARLTPADEKILTSLGDALTSATLKPCCFEIQGHTDSIGSASYNKRLSQRRAEAVVAYLADHDAVDRDRMIPQGLGMTQPIATNKTAAGRAKNRRVQIVNLGYGTASAD